MSNGIGGVITEPFRPTKVAPSTRNEKPRMFRRTIVVSNRSAQVAPITGAASSGCGTRYPAGRK